MATGRPTTIFRQLIFNIALPTLLALLVFAGINFQRQRDNLVSGTEEKNRLLSNEIIKILRFQDIAFNLIDGEFNKRFRDISSLLLNKYFVNTDNIADLDLRKIANEVGMDPINEDIYIISKDGIVVNTTFTNDMGLDLYGLGEKMKIFLQGILQKKEFTADLFAIEHTTHRPKKYTYQATRDGKYIVELGAYSRQVEDIIQAIEDSKDEIKSETPGIVDVELFLMADFPFSMNRDVMEVAPKQDELLLQAFIEKDTINYLEKVGSRWYHYQYIYMERTKSSEQPMSGLYKGSVIRIISDRTAQKALFRVEAKRFILIFILTMIVLTILIYRKTMVITRPLKLLVENVDRITDGNLRERAEVTGNNEITRLSEKFNMMIAQLESYYYELEAKVKERTLKIEKQKEEIEEQKKHIMDSIHYARRIQNAILPSFAMIENQLRKYFILYLPKDIVSGDFYWAQEADGKFMIAAVDCTGHGVPGAFMSIVGFNQLNYAVSVRKARSASVILDELNQGVITTLNENMSNTSIKDGMDLSLLVLDLKKKKAEFAGANNPMILVRKGEMIKYKPDRFPIGAFDENKPKSFTNNEIDLQDGDCMYLFSDGYADQFGGPENKKFMSRRFEELLLEIHANPPETQKEILKRRLDEWRGLNEQVDDILVIGIIV